MKTSLPLLALLLPAMAAGLPAAAPSPERPHIVLVMADDMGWGQTGYRGHPVLKTPHLDAMAAAGSAITASSAGESADRRTKTRASGRSRCSNSVVERSVLRR